MIILDAFDLDFKLAKRSKFGDGFIMRLLEIDESEHARFLRECCREIEPSQLRSLMPGTQITYVRRDNGKIVSKAVVVEHKRTRDNDEITMLSFGAPHTIAVTKGAYDRGYMRVPTLAPMRFFISSDNLERLYVMKANDAEMQVIDLKTRLDSGEQIIALQEHRIRTLEDDSDALKRELTAMKKEMEGMSRLCAFLSTKLKQTHDVVFGVNPKQYRLGSGATSSDTPDLRCGT